MSSNGPDYDIVSRTFTYSAVPRTFGKVALTPFPDNSVKTKSVGEGEVKVVLLANDKTKLVALTVCADAYANDGRLIASTGTTALVRADLYSSPWGKEVFTDPSKPDRRFVLLPLDRVEVFL